jgi:hypothetical protein
MRFMGRVDFFSSTTDEAEQQLLQAAQNEPKPIVLMSGDIVHIQPKSMEALQWLRIRDMGVAWLQAYVEVIQASLDEGWTGQDTDTSFTLLERADTEIGSQLRLMAYAVCNYGVKIDRAELDSEDFVIPPPFDDIDPIDLIRVHKAFWEVNVLRLNHLPYLLGPTKPGSDSKRMSWNVFYGTMAMKLNTDMEYLMKDKSLVALLAQVRLAQPTDLEDLKAS